MNPDLIKQLEALSPTEGEWEFNEQIWMVVSHEGENGRQPIASTYHIHDSRLITLAPTMRLVILDMAKEIEELKNEIMKLKRFNSTKKILGGKPKIQMVTACGRFEINPMFTSATLCKNCGKEKALHVTPQPK